MKKVLLATSALFLTAGVASAELTYSGSAKLTYGGYGTGTDAYAGEKDAIAATTDVAITMAGEAGGISYSASLELDEDGGLAQGPLSMSSNGLSIKVDKDDIGGLATAGADGEDDNYGDVLLSFSNSGISVSYEMDTASDDYKMSASYTAAGLTLTATDIDESSKGGDDKSTFGVSYALGDMTIAASADDQDDWDASVAYKVGDAKITVASDETSMYSLGVSAAMGNLSLTARQEFNNPAGTEDETEFSVTYAAGDMTVTFSSDSGQSGKFGDEAESKVVFGYNLAEGIAFEAKANDQEELEMSIGFTF